MFILIFVRDIQIELDFYRKNPEVKWHFPEFWTLASPSRSASSTARGTSSAFFLMKTSTNEVQLSLARASPPLCGSVSQLARPEFRPIESARYECAAAENHRDTEPLAHVKACRLRKSDQLLIRFADVLDEKPQNAVAKYETPGQHTWPLLSAAVSIKRPQDHK